MPEGILPDPLPIDPNQEIKIQSIEAELYPDGRRVKVTFTLSSFTNGPNASVTLSSNKTQIASVSIVNIFVPENEITLHIPGSHVKSGTYHVDLELFFIIEEEIEDQGELKIRLQQSQIDSASVSFTIQ